MEREALLVEPPQPVLRTSGVGPEPNTVHLGQMAGLLPRPMVHLSQRQPVLRTQ
jgi:hypothetical protein